MHVGVVFTAHTHSIRKTILYTATVVCFFFVLFFVFFEVPTVCGLTIEYKHILAALIDSEQMLLSIEAQLCTRKECKTFRPRRPSSVAMHKVRVRRCPTSIVT